VTDVEKLHSETNTEEEAEMDDMMIRETIQFTIFRALSEKCCSFGAIWETCVKLIGKSSDLDGTQKG